MCAWRHRPGEECNPSSCQTNLTRIRFMVRLSIVGSIVWWTTGAPERYPLR
jgi:hypothetical protein